VACDFFVTVTSTFRLLYVLVVIEHRSRRLIYCDVTAHPTATWTRQQMREVLGFDTRYLYLIHDRDSIFSREFDACIGSLGIGVLKTPRAPAYGVGPGGPRSSSDGVEISSEVTSLSRRLRLDTEQSGARRATSRVLRVSCVSGTQYLRSSVLQKHAE
jgi:hypothetical protein